jgi:hypothetical protein
MRRLTRRRAFLVSLTLAIVAFLPSTAQAQITSLGATTTGLARNGTNSAVAYDDKHDVYLQVWEDNSTVTGRFLNFDGTPAGVSFIIATPQLTVAWMPRVAYSRGTSDDVFVVLWTDAAGPFTSAPGSASFQRLRYTGTGSTAATLVGGPVAVSPLETGHSQSGLDVVFNPVAREFLVSWVDWPVVGIYSVPRSADVFVRPFGMDASALAAAINASTLPFNNISAFYEVESAAVVVDWQRNRYFVDYYDQNVALHGPLDSGLGASLLDGTSAQRVATPFTLQSCTSCNGPVAATTARLRSGMTLSAPSCRATPRARSRT